MHTDKGLTCFCNDDDCILLDPDNVFWANISKDSQKRLLIQQDVLSTYERVRERLDKEIRDFRFGTTLVAIYIDPTDRCNLNCPYCYIPSKIRKYGGEMTKEQLTYVLNRIREHFNKSRKKPVIIFHAAEPLLVKNIIFEAIKEYRNKFYFGLQTNAILLKKEDVEYLKRYRVGVGISLDSFNPSKNNRLRPDSFRKIVNAIKWFDGYEGLNVITTITKFNVSDLPYMVKFLHNLRVPSVLLNPMRLTQKNSWGFKPDEKLLTKYFIKAVDTALELSKKSNHRIIIGNFANIILGIVSPTARRLMCDISPCGGGRCFLTITASGDMIPCGEFIGIKGFSGGNIFKSSIKDAMRSRPFKRVRARIVERIDVCKECIFKNICGAPCPAELHSLGNMFKKSVFCNFYKEIIKYAFGVIAKGEEKYLLRADGLKNLKYEYRL
ncbi:MAG: peptide-modifying radical SAM enzyme CbpB [Candidatus Hydrogenedentota bacterium]